MPILTSGEVEYVVGDTQPPAILHPVVRGTQAPIPIADSGYSVVIRFHTVVDGRRSKTTEKTATIFDDGGVDAAKYAFTAADLDIGDDPLSEAELYWEWRITFPDSTVATTLKPKRVRIRTRL